MNRTLMGKHVWLVGLILVLGTVLSGCSSMREGQTGPSAETRGKMSNTDLEKMIKARIESDPKLKAADLTVTADVEKNEAELSGTLNSEVLRTRAVQLAKDARPGLLVVDKIEVKPREVSRREYSEEMGREERERAESYGEKVGRTLDDAWIHTKVAAKLVANAETPGRTISVDVVDNVVTLRGTVENARQKEEAGRIARETEGVKSVRNLVKVGK